MPRLPRKVARRPGRHRRTNPGPRAPPSTISATPATQNDGRCELVPRLPRDIKVHVTKCHACHAKWRGAPGVTGDKSRPKGATQYHKCHALPRKTTVDVRLCHACHVISRWMSPSATPATQSGAAPRASQATNPGPRAPPSTISATHATQNDGRCEIVPRLPRDIKVHVTKCHACHAKWRGAPGVTGDKSRPKGATQYHKCHACHAKRR